MTARRRRPRRARATTGSRLVATLLLLVYGVLVAAVAYWPTPVDRGMRPRIDRVLAALHRRGLPDWFGYDQLEWWANVAFFVPLGLLVVLLIGGHRWWVAVLVGGAASVAIEVGQHLFLPSRYATVDDVVANTLGAALGALSGLVLLAVVHARRRAKDRRAVRRLEV